jgi:ABC-2 type transport system permease protein
VKPKPFVILASLCLFLIFAGGVTASNRLLSGVRFDFTAKRLYTLSASAEDVVRRVAEPIRIELHYSGEAAAGYPAIRAHAARVRELLAAIAARGRGRIEVREIAVEPFSESEDRAAAAGLASVETGSGDPIYLGVIGRNTVDDEIVIPFLAPERDAFLEYDLVRLIAQLDAPDLPAVAVLTSLPALSGDGTSPGDALVLREMARAFRIVQVERDFETLPPEADILLMVHPSPLSDRQQHAIDQFLLSKGRALIAVDPVSRTSQAAGRPASSSLGGLERTLGVSIPAGEVIADPSIALPVEAGPGGRGLVEGQPLFLAVTPETASKDDIVTADLSRAIHLGLAGRILGQADAAKRGFVPLLQATARAGAVDAAFAATDPSPRAATAAIAPLRGAPVLAVRITAELTTAFPDRPLETGGERLTRSHVPAEIILVADADVFEDVFYVDPASGAPLADNAAFILNALDNLGGDPALLALRSRAPAARPMERVEALQAAARERLYAEQARLEASLSETEARLGELERREPGQALVRSDARSAEIAGLRAEASETRARLRAIEREYRADIDRLELGLRLAVIWAPALLAALAGLAVFAWRSRRPGGAG